MKYLDENVVLVDAADIKGILERSSCKNRPEIINLAIELIGPDDDFTLESWSSRLNRAGIEIWIWNYIHSNFNDVQSFVDASELSFK
jgi:hypothetical protein